MARCTPRRAAAQRARRLAAEARAAGARLVSNATVIGFFPEDVGRDGRPGVLAVATDAGLVRVSARRTLYATGAYDQNLPFADNDRPGVIAARALGRLAFRWGIRPVAPAARVVILDGGPDGGAAGGRARRDAGVAGRAGRASRDGRSWPRWAASACAASRSASPRGEGRRPSPAI